MTGRFADHLMRTIQKKCMQTKKCKKKNIPICVMITAVTTVGGIGGF
jgi:hypothetical protein